LSPSDIEKENLDAYNKLLDQKEIEDKGRLGNYRYYKDKIGNRYGWYTNKQKDGKFHAFIWNKRSRNTKRRIFAKRKTAKKWCHENFSKANNRQLDVIKARQKRKEEREALKPKLTPTQKAIKRYTDKIEHYNGLIKKCDVKIKSQTTRKKTYIKKWKYCLRQIEKIGDKNAERKLIKN